MIGAGGNRRKLLNWREWGSGWPHDDCPELCRHKAPRTYGLEAFTQLLHVCLCYSIYLCEYDHRCRIRFPPSCFVRVSAVNLQGSSRSSRGTAIKTYSMFCIFNSRKTDAGRRISIQIPRRSRLFKTKTRRSRQQGK